MPTGELTVVVFYDENGNGGLDPQEQVRLTDVEVRLSGQTLQTFPGSGHVIFESLRDGQHMVSIQGGLPPFYVAPPPVQVTIPRGDPLNLPVTLPIASNSPNRYLAFGDSITDGHRSTDGSGWVGPIDGMLRAYFGVAEVIKDAVPATRSHNAADRIAASLAAHRPAYTLVMYGINDYNDPDCRRNPPCFTIDSLRSVVQDVKAAGSLPFLATITPSNTYYDFRAPPYRNELSASMNVLLREMAAEEGAVLVDLEAAFLAFGPPNESGLLYDHVHPNDAGYQLVAETFFEALIHAQTPAAAWR
jgi:lysophospholipase L1-like esterase